MAEHVKAWAPILKGNDRPSMSLAVRCGEKAPNKEQYRVLLEARLESLIAADPKQALLDLELVSTPEYPGLYPELPWYPSHQWAFHIMLSCEMRMMLNRIDWERANPVELVQVEELPSLIDILEMI